MPQWIEHKEVKLFSLMFERAHGWTGLLVEPHPLIFAKVTRPHSVGKDGATDTNTNTNKNIETGSNTDRNREKDSDKAKNSQVATLNAERPTSSGAAGAKESMECCDLSCNKE